MEYDSNSRRPRSGWAAKTMGWQKQLGSLFTSTFWVQSAAGLRDFLHGHVRAVRGLGRRGERTDIHSSVRFGYPGHIYLGDGCGIGAGCHIYAGPTSSIRIGDGTLLGPQVFITSDAFGGSRSDLTKVHSGHEAPIKIGANVRIGAHAVILPGVAIGDGATIGAATVVTRNVPPGVIAVGNPARIISPES